MDIIQTKEEKNVVIPEVKYNESFEAEQNSLNQLFNVLKANVEGFGTTERAEFDSILQIQNDSQREAAIFSQFEKLEQRYKGLDLNFDTKENIIREQEPELDGKVWGDPHVDLPNLSYREFDFPENVNLLDATTNDYKGVLGEANTSHVDRTALENPASSYTAVALTNTSGLILNGHIIEPAQYPNTTAVGSMEMKIDNHMITFNDQGVVNIDGNVLQAGSTVQLGNNQSIKSINSTSYTNPFNNNYKNNSFYEVKTNYGNFVFGTENAGCDQKMWGVKYERDGYVREIITEANAISGLYKTSETSIIVAAYEYGYLTGDPHLRGADGEKYDIVGPGKVYSVVKDKNFNYNAKIDYVDPWENEGVTESTIAVDSSDFRSIVYYDKTGTATLKKYDRHTGNLVSTDTIAAGQTYALADGGNVKYGMAYGGGTDGKSQETRLILTTAEGYVVTQVNRGNKYIDSNVETGGNGVNMDGIMPSGILGDTFDLGSALRVATNNNKQGVGVLNAALSEYQLGSDIGQAANVGLKLENTTSANTNNTTDTNSTNTTQTNTDTTTGTTTSGNTANTNTNTNTQTTDDTQTNTNNDTTQTNNTGNQDNQDNQGNQGGNTNNTTTDNQSVAKIITGDSGKNHLKGGKEDNIYELNAGSGKDKITDLGGNDVIKFGNNVDKDNVVFLQKGANLVIDYGTKDSVTVNNYFTKNKSIENIQFQNNGTAVNLDKNDINKIIQVMTAFADENEIDINSVKDVRGNQELMNLVVANMN